MPLREMSTREKVEAGAKNVRDTLTIIQNRTFYGNKLLARHAAETLVVEAQILRDNLIKWLEEGE